MIKYSIALLCGAFFLASCTPKDTSDKTTSEKSGEACVAGYVETSPGKGTLDIYFPSTYSPDVQSIADVSIEVAEEVTNEMGAC